MKVQCGTDIIEVERVKKAIEDSNDRFKERIYTINEISYCDSKGKTKFEHYAARFAAKEAIYKAISNELKDKYEITWKDVEIINDINGKPNIVFINKVLENKIDNIDISLSHIKEYAIASCVVIFK